jgi:chemotaxis protein MotB
MAKKHGHHGGAWKVAYADFVTAMMALFLVLWLTAQDTKIKEAIERAFRNPFASLTKESVGIIPNKETQAVKADGGNFDSSSVMELTMLRKLNQDLLLSLQNPAEDPAHDPVKLEMVPEGLRISVFDRARKPIFEPNSDKLTEYGKWVITTLAWNIARYGSFAIELEGHTESGHKPVSENYGDWELSSSRANVTRRLLTQHGVKEDQIKKVAGFAATVPMPDTEPQDEINRRVTVMLRARSGS